MPKTPLTLGSSLPKLNIQTMMYKFEGEDKEFPAECYEQVARQRLNDAFTKLIETMWIQENPPKRSP